MADKTFGVKVSEELHEKVKNMIENSGNSAKEWFEKAVAISEMQSIKQGAVDYNQDLTELEVHTARIYELVSNMIQRSVYIKDYAVKEIAEKLEQKEAIIGEYQEKLNNAVIELKQAQESIHALENNNKELHKQIENQQSSYENNQLLIHEYKEKNDTLSGLVNKYQAFANENEKLKEQLTNEREQLQSKVSELTNQIKDKQGMINELQQRLESSENNHIIEMERINERKDLEREKALLETEREYQQKLSQANDEYNNKIKSLFDQINSIPKENEQTKQKKQTDHKNKG